VLEVNTRRALTREARMADLAEALEFTRRYLGSPAPAGRQHASASGGRAQAGDGRAQAGDGAAQAGKRREDGARPAGSDPVGPRGSAPSH
jgi:hypothetical protein